MRNSNGCDDKVNLLQASITGVLYLFLKDKQLEEDIEAFRNKSHEKSSEVIKNFITSDDDFKGVLDKKNIYQNAINTICNCFSNNILSESTLFHKTNNLLEGYTEQDKLKFLEFIVIFALSDNVITDRERESLSQFVSYFGFSENELSTAITKYRPKKSKLKALLFFLLACIISVLVFVYITEAPIQNQPDVSTEKPERPNISTTIVHERITSCSYLIEERKDSAKEFESGMAFARCVNEWKITEKMQTDIDALNDNERNVPQENFELFKAFLRSPEYPKNLFNWILGVLSVKPDPEYLPYLAVFQKGCMNYLISLTGSSNPLVDYFKGRNPEMNVQTNNICNSNSTLLSCGELQSILETDFLLKKEKLKLVLIDRPFMVFEGDMDKEEEYSIVENSSLESTDEDTVWIYNSNKINHVNAEKVYIKITEKEIGFDKQFFIAIYSPYFPMHSIQPSLEMSRGRNNIYDEALNGFDFNELFARRDPDAKSIEYRTMAQFAFEKMFSDYDTKRPEPYYPKHSDNIHLLGLVETESGNMRFEHLGTTVMENGSVNINIEEGKLDFLHPGGFLIYAYDIDNRKFGVISNLMQPRFDGGYITSNGLFLSLD